MSHILLGIYEYPHTPYMTKARPPNCRSVLNKLQAAADKLSALSEEQRDPDHPDTSCEKAKVEINFNMVYDFHTKKYNYCDFRQKPESASTNTSDKLPSETTVKSLPKFETSVDFDKDVHVPILAGQQDDRRDESFESLSHPSMVSEKLLSMMIQNKLHNIQKIITSAGIDPTTILGKIAKIGESKERASVQLPNRNEPASCRRYNSTVDTNEGNIPRYYTSSYREKHIPRYYTSSYKDRNIPRYYTSTQRNDIPGYHAASGQAFSRQFTSSSTEAFYISRYSLKRKRLDNKAEVDNTKPFKFAKPDS